MFDADAFVHRTVRLAEVDLHVVEAGEPGAPLVVLLHGFPEIWRSWRHQLRALADAGFHAVAPDMRGYNLSSKPRGVDAYRVERLAADVAGLVRALGARTARVAGHDWGAMVAWELAMHHPNVVERLAILNVPHPVRMKQGLRSLRQLRRSWYVFFFQLPFAPEALLRANDLAGLRHTLAESLAPTEIEHYVSAFAREGALTGAINYYRAAARAVVTGRGRRPQRIDQPVLVVWGERDRFLGKELAVPPGELVPDARVVFLPEASHWVQNDAPDRVNELLIEFFRA